MKKRAAGLICALALSAALALPGAAAGYTDVPAGMWYSSAVAEMTEKGYMNGVGNGLFQPDAPVTRGAVVTALWRLEESPAAPAAASFTDVASGSWYSGAVDWAVSAGIASGDGSGAFHPDGVATRQELAVLLHHYARYQKWDDARGSLELYSDAEQISSWARDSFSYAVGMGLLEGNDGRLTPNGTATRAQLAVILQRLITPAMG